MAEEMRPTTLESEAAAELALRRAAHGFADACERDLECLADCLRSLQDAAIRYRRAALARARDIEQHPPSGRLTGKGYGRPEEGEVPVLCPVHGVREP